MTTRRELANQQAVEIFQRADPRIVDIRLAHEVIPGMDDDLILHAGPPILWENMCGPMRGAVLGALVYEGKASTLEDAAKLCDSGQVRFEPCHQHASVAPMAGIISSSMPVWVIEDRVNQTRAYSNLNEGPGHALRYGANSPEVIARLHWMRETLAPRLREAIHTLGELPTFSLIREALAMGDECHSRNRAALTLLVQTLASTYMKTTLPQREIGEILDFLIGRDYFFLNITMASCKAAWLAAEAIPDASVVTAFSRNGVEFSIRVQGRWFAAPSPVVDGHYFPGFTATDANLDIGDSAITEASGLGGFAVGCAPSIIGFIGSTPDQLSEAMLEMYEISSVDSAHFGAPFLAGRGTPTGVDVFKVLETGVRPFITTGIAHREPGMGQIGAGRVRAPLACFEKAATYLNLAE